MEPLHDVPAEGMGHHDQQQHGFVPDDPSQEPLEVLRRAPLDVEETDERPDEDQEVRHAEIGARPAHPLDEDRSRQHDDSDQDRVGDEHTEGQDEHGHGQTCSQVDPDGQTCDRSHSGDHHPGKDGSGRSAPSSWVDASTHLLQERGSAHRRRRVGGIGPRGASGASLTTTIEA